VRLLLAVAGTAAVSGFVTVGGHRLYYTCTGHGSPTVVLDAGSPDTLVVWSTVQPQIARLTRVCAYDRAGLGLSGRATGHRTAQTQAHELRALLARAHVHPPYVVVGHSWGGLIARLFASDYRRNTAGVVLVDATTFPYGTPPLPTNREGIDIAASVRESDAVTTLGNLPLVVLGSNRPPLSPTFLRAQDNEAALSSDSVDAIARRSTHYLQSPPPRGQPDVVVAAVRAVVEAARTHGRLPSCRAIFAGRSVACR
jgi:pimeloyl-ACP methyl ester carboxylesterase